MKLFGNNRKQERTITKAVNEYFSYINGYTPSFISFSGGLYEMELTRSCIDSFASYVSKTKPQIIGNDKIRRILDKPNSLMTTSQFLYRLATVYQVNNTAFIVPLYDNRNNLVGLYPICSDKCDIRNYNGTSYLVYEIYTGHKESIELSKCGRLVRHQYSDEIFGESNDVMNSTLELINTQNQAIIEGAKSNATIRFMGKLSSIMDSDDIVAEQDRIRKDSLGANNNGGVLLFDSKYSEIKQITSTPYVVSKEQEELIKHNVYTYFHTNELILTNNYDEEQFTAYYEGCIEPFIVQLAQVLNGMLSKELMIGQEIIITSNRLQYANTQTKLSYVSSLLDRGVISVNDAREVFGLGRVDGEEYDKLVIRKDYTTVNDMDTQADKGGE